MRGRFETDTRYPWSVQLTGDRWQGINLHTNERLAGAKDYKTAQDELDAHLAKVRKTATTSPRAAA